MGGPCWFRIESSALFCWQFGGIASETNVVSTLTPVGAQNSRVVRILIEPPFGEKISQPKSA